MSKAKKKRKPQPWERQNGETLKQWEAFRIYRDMGYHRTKEKVRDSLGLKTDRHMDVWSSKFNWVARTLAYDDEQDRLKRAATTKAEVKALTNAKRLTSAALERLVGQLVQRLTGQDGSKPLPATPLGAKLLAETYGKLMDIQAQVGAVEGPLLNKSLSELVKDALNQWDAMETPPTPTNGGETDEDQAT